VSNPVDIRPTTDLEFRFWEKVAYVGADWKDCLEWRASKNNQGYGVFWINGRYRLAYNTLWRWICGPVPDGLELHHLCHNRICVNPWHIVPVTKFQNLSDNVQKRKTHCPQGHEYTLENTSYSYGRRQPHGGRHCRACSRERSRLYREKQRARA
jgi:hypothetical protein